MHHTKIRFAVEFYVLTAFFLLLIPLKWVLSWFIAVLVHELAHYLALRMLKVDVYCVSIGASGAVMQTAPMQWYIEIICTVAGPVAGFCLCFVGKWFPYVALFGFLQSVFNLIPVFPLDGGRILRCCSEHWFPSCSDRICIAVKWIAVLVLSVMILKLFGTEPILLMCAASLLFKN